MRRIRIGPRLNGAGSTSASRLPFFAGGPKLRRETRQRQHRAVIRQAIRDYCPTEIWPSTSISANMLENTLNATMVTLKTRTAAKLHSPNNCKSPESYSVGLQLQPLR